LIQRDYSHESFYDYYNHSGATASNPQDVKMTDSGRTVYGGGGITPDEVYKAPAMDRLESQLFRNGLFAFTRTYFATHSVKPDAGWMPDATTIRELHDYLLNNNYKFSEPEFAGDTDWIRRYLAKEMYVWVFGKDESDRIFAQTDPEVAKAVESLPKAQALTEAARKVIAQRMAPRQ
jgi:carboxyl-terminal processing protease